MLPLELHHQNAGSGSVILCLFLCLSVLHAQLLQKLNMVYLIMFTI